MYFIGVDAGGTKTTFLLADENGYIHARYNSGSGRFFDKGADGVYALAEEGINALCARVGITKHEIGYAAFGFPGYGEKEGSEQAIIEACEKALAPGRVVCVCDCYLGWAGSLAMQPGVNMVAGTGSIGYGVDAQGLTARAGGWGAFCDEGSCWWLGGRLIQWYAKQSDGRMPRTLLYEKVRTSLNIQNDMEFIHTVNHFYGENASETAGLQRLLQEVYKAGDPHAAALYQEAAEELWLTAEAVARKLALPEGFALSYSGGLFKSGECILAPLRALAERHGAVFTVPRFTPEQGAILTAMRAAWPNKDFNGFAFKEK